MEMTDSRIFITYVQFKGQDSNCVNMTDGSIDVDCITLHCQDRISQTLTLDGGE
jgi:hypothetical protein